MTPRIELHIEELVLHGFSPRDRALISAAVEAELSRLLSEAAPPFDRDTNIARLDGGTFSVATNAGPQAVGAQVAHAVHRGLNPAQGGPNP